MSCLYSYSQEKGSVPAEPCRLGRRACVPIKNHKGTYQKKELASGWENKQMSLQGPYFGGSEMNLKNMCLIQQWRATEHSNVEEQHNRSCSRWMCSQHGEQVRVGRDGKWGEIRGSSDSVWNRKWESELELWPWCLKGDRLFIGWILWKRKQGIKWLLFSNLVNRRNRGARRNCLAIKLVQLSSA